MTYQDEWLTVYQGDCREVMAGMEAESVDCVVTSPPYWGLRDYGHEGQLGQERTSAEYVEAMVDVFRGVHRVLRPSGSLWLNLGDTYIDKQLLGIPWRVALALQADGWRLRSDIIWAKPNPMPESVSDRPTKSHEYLFMLTQSADYFWDGDAVREEWKPNPYDIKRANDDHPGYAGKNDDPQWSSGIRGQPVGDPSKGRNIRTVWTVSSVNYSGAHFAVFPPKLIEPCIKVGCPPGGMVLDPFAGSGTTGMVAQSLSRRATLIDLSTEYLGQVMERNRDIPLGLA